MEAASAAFSFVCLAAPPILLGLTLNSGRFRIFDLHPMRRHRVLCLFIMLTVGIA